MMEEAPYKTLTDEQYMETMRHGCADFPFRYYEEDVWKFDLHRIDWHWHKEVEFVYAERGDVVCYAGTDKFTLPQGCGLFVNSGALHRYEAKKSVSMPNIVFLPELLGAADGRVFRKYIKPVLRLGAGHLLLCPQDGRQREMLEILTSVFALWRTSEPSELVTVQKLLALWQLLAEQLPPAEGAHQPGETAHGKRLQLMMHYIHERYRQPISLQDIAAAVYVSKNSALQIFREGIRTSPIAYLIEYRLARAAELLASTEKSVAAVAAETGFESAAYFSRKFKQHYGISPSLYALRER